MFNILFGKITANGIGLGEWRFKAPLSKLSPNIIIISELPNL